MKKETIHNKILLIKSGNPLDEYISFDGGDTKNFKVHAPKWDYVSQFYQECYEILKENRFKIYWVGLNSDSYGKSTIKNSTFITLGGNILNSYVIKSILLLYYLLEIRPNVVINISGFSISLIPLYLYKIINRKDRVKIYQFLGEYLDENQLFINFIFKGLKKFEAMYVMNNDTKNLLEKNYKKKVKIFNPLYTNCFYDEVTEIHTVDKNNFNVFYCGRFSNEKGIWELFEIIKKINDSNIIFHLIGEGRNYIKFKWGIEQLALKNKVKFYGFVPHNQLYGYLRQADVGLMPSRSEGYGQVAVEFLLSNVPVIATKIGGLKDIIEDGINGFLISNDNKILEFINKIQYLKEN